MSEPQLFVGIDVAKAQLDIALRPTGECWTVPNDDPSIAHWSSSSRPSTPRASCWKPRAAAGLPVVVVNPRCHFQGG
jgi:hypothetical protein